MKKLFFLLMLFAFIACQETVEEAEEQTAEVQEKVITDAITEKADDENKTGLTFYDQSKLVFQPAQVLPIDESKKNKTLRKTLEELLVVIEQKDVEGLKPFIAQDVLLGFGGDGGLEEFMTFWNLDLSPDKSMLWEVLKTTITLGGTFSEENENAYFTPYVFTTFPDEYDIFEFGVIVGKQVNIRAEPNLKGKLVRQLTHEIVRVVAYDKPSSTRTQTIGNETHDWMKIEMADGKTGYVWGKFFRSSIDYRAGFATVRDEGWKMTFLIAGD